MVMAEHGPVADYFWQHSKNRGTKILCLLLCSSFPLKGAPRPAQKNSSQCQLHQGPKVNTSMLREVTGVYTPAGL